MKKLVNICRAIHVKAFLVALAVLFVSVVSGTTVAQAVEVTFELHGTGGQQITWTDSSGVSGNQCVHRGTENIDGSAVLGPTVCTTDLNPGPATIGLWLLPFSFNEGGGLTYFFSSDISDVVGCNIGSWTFVPNAALADCTMTVTEGSKVSVFVNAGEINLDKSPGPLNKFDSDLEVSRSGVSIPGNVSHEDGVTGLSTPLEYTLTNAGTTDLYVQDIRFDNFSNVSGVSLASALPGPISSGTDGTVQIKYQPMVAGDFSFDVSIFSSDPDQGTYKFTVTGTVSAVVSHTLTVAGDGSGSGNGTVEWGVDAAYNLTCTIAGGTVTGTSGDVCTNTGAGGTAYKLRASAPDAGWAFSSWDGCTTTSGTNNEICEITPLLMQL